MGRVLLFLAVLVLHIYVLVDIAGSPRDQVRILSKWLWLLVSLLPVIGPVAWLVAGRPLVGPGSGGGPGGGIGGAPRPGRGPLAPDDDPEFLKRLDEQSWAARMERLRRERQAGGESDTPPEGPPSGSSGSPAGEPPGDQAPRGSAG